MSETKGIYCMYAPPSDTPTHHRQDSIICALAFFVARCPLWRATKPMAPYRAVSYGNLLINRKPFTIFGCSMERSSDCQYWRERVSRLSVTRYADPYIRRSRVWAVVGKGNPHGLHKLVEPTHHSRRQPLPGGHPSHKMQNGRHS